MRSSCVLILVAGVASAGALWTPVLAADPLPPTMPSLLPPEECGEGAEPCPSPGERGEGAAQLLSAGTAAPAFDLVDPEGAPVPFRAETGMEPVLLVFWSLFCPPCQEEMPLFVDLALRHPPPELRVIAVNLDGASLARAVIQYARRQQLPFLVAMDEKRGDRFTAATAYGVTGTPSLVLIGRDGAVVWSYEGRVDPLELESAVTYGLQ